MDLTRSYIYFFSVAAVVPSTLLLSRSAINIRAVLITVYCTSYLLERGILGQHIGDLIRNSTFAKVIHFCINFKQKGKN
jgi:hypothetical protein